jgi:hypothetical protein
MKKNKIFTMIVALGLMTSTSALAAGVKCQASWDDVVVPALTKQNMKINELDKNTSAFLTENFLRSDEGQDLVFSTDGSIVYFAYSDPLGSFWIVDKNGCLIGRAIVPLEYALEIVGKGT